MDEKNPTDPVAPKREEVKFMKKIYSTPKLAIYGTVESLTKGVGVGTAELFVLCKDLV